MGRTEDLAWCKQRAIELLDMGQPLQAVSSFISDSMKSESTHLSMGQLKELQGYAEKNEGPAIRRWIEEIR